MENGVGSLFAEYLPTFVTVEVAKIFRSCHKYRTFLFLLFSVQSFRDLAYTGLRCG